MDAESRKRADEYLGRYYGRCQFCTDRPRIALTNRSEDYALTYKVKGRIVTCYWSKLCDGCEDEIATKIAEDDSDLLLDVVRLRFSWRAAALALIE